MMKSRAVRRYHTNPCFTSQEKSDVCGIDPTQRGLILCPRIIEQSAEEQYVWLCGSCCQRMTVDRTGKIIPLETPPLCNNEVNWDLAPEPIASICCVVMIRFADLPPLFISLAIAVPLMMLFVNFIEFGMLDSRFLREWLAYPVFFVIAAASLFVGKSIWKRLRGPVL